MKKISQKFFWECFEKRVTCDEIVFIARRGNIKKLHGMPYVFQPTSHFVLLMVSYFHKNYAELIDP